MISPSSVTDKTQLKSIFLLADSGLLFWRENGLTVLGRVLNERSRDGLKAAYLGASNGDHPAYYEIFVAAMEGAGIFDCRMIPSTVSEADMAFLDDANIILLAGGDVEAGWKVFVTNGMSEHIVRRYFEGASLIGISAGAVQLGLCGLAADGSLIDTFKLAPFIVGAHEESTDWKTTRELLRLSPPGTTAIGLPTGGGAIYHPDRAVIPLRHPLVELRASAQSII